MQSLTTAIICLGTLGGIGFFIINNKLNNLMAKQSQLDEALASINEATNNIATDLLNLKAQIESGGVTQESLDALTAAAEKLQAVAAETPDEEPQG